VTSMSANETVGSARACAAVESESSATSAAGRNGMAPAYFGGAGGAVVKAIGGEGTVAAMSDADLSRLEAIARERCRGADAAHDFQHVCRVAASASRIAGREGADSDIAVAAAWLHELFNYPKDHPESRRSGQVCAEHAHDVLRAEGWPEERAAHVAG